MKIFLWIIGSLIVFFLIIVIIIQIPAVQNFAKDKAVTYLEGKIKTKVTVQNIDIEFPKKVVLDGVYFEDQQSDTILIAKKMAVDISLFKILNNIIEINSINLQDATAKILRDKNEKYNFDYIIQAFVNPKKPKDNSPPMEFSIDKINLDNVNFYFNDAISGNNISVKLTHFDTRIKKFDLNKMEFEIPKAKLAGLKLKLKQGIGIVQSETTSKKSLPEKDLKIKLGDLDLSKIDFYYYNENSKLTNTILLQKLFISFDEIDLKKEFIAIKNIQLTDTNGNLELGELKEIISQTDLATTPTSNNWKVKITQANFKKINFKFDDFNSLPTDKKLDYRHLDIKNLNLNAEKISYAIQKTSGKINSFTVKEKSGLDIQSLKTDFIYTNNKGVSLKNLYLKTPQTSLKDEIIISYPSVSILQENIGELGIIAHLQNSKLGFKDVLLFVPTLEKTSPFDKNPNAVLNINSKISGKLKNITFPNLEISGIGNTKIAASGRIIGLPDFKKAYFDLAIKKLQSNSKDIYSFVPLGTIPNTIAIPNLFEVRGFFRGTYDNFNTNLNLVSSFGDAKIKAVFDQRQKDKEKYDAKTELDNFDVGKLIKDKTVGKITAKATIKGVGLNPKTANALVEGAIQKAVFNNYTYQNLKLKGNINKGLFNLNADSNDPNLIFDMVSNGSVRDKYPAAKLMLNIDIADLNRLNLHAGPMKIRGIINANFQTLDLDYLNGTLTTNKFIIANKIDQFVLDSINVVALSNFDKNSILIKSQFANADINGKYKLSQISNVIQNSISKYYATNPKYKKTQTENQHFVFNIDIQDSPILFKLIPDLKSLEPINLSGKYNSVNDTLAIHGSIPRIVYGNNKISGAVINVDTKDNSLVYNLIIGNVENINFQLPYTSLSGKVENNILDYKLLLKDSKDKERYVIMGNLKSIYGNSEIKLDPTNLILNYEAWNLSE